jgi:hypothetical protein
MTTDYGQRIVLALQAIRQLHADTSRLLVDFGKTVGAGWISVFGNYATRDLTYNVNADFWMAEGVYRYWARKENLGTVKALTVCFFGRGIKEPLLLVSQLKYRMDGASEIKSVCKEWDLWQLFFDWSDQTIADDMLSFAGADKGRIESANLVAKPLYAIAQLDDVAAMMNRVDL